MTCVYFEMIFVTYHFTNKFLNCLLILIPLIYIIYRIIKHYYIYKYKLGKHRSNALELIQKVPPIEVEGDVAVCDGGGGALGHPLEYIKVGNRNGEPASCIYCGLRYVAKDAH